MFWPPTISLITAKTVNIVVNSIGIEMTPTEIQHQFATSLLPLHNAKCHLFKYGCEFPKRYINKHKTLHSWLMRRPKSLPRNIYLFIRMGLNVALTHQHRSYRDSETKEKVEAQKRKL